MPDFKNLERCRFVDGNLYCWDKNRDDFVQVELKLIINPVVYKKVVAAFMEENKEEALSRALSNISNND